MSRVLLLLKAGEAKALWTRYPTSTGGFLVVELLSI